MLGTRVNEAVATSEATLRGRTMVNGVEREGGVVKVMKKVMPVVIHGQTMTVRGNKCHDAVKNPCPESITGQRQADGMLVLMNWQAVADEW